MSQKSKFEIKLFQEFWDKLEAIESKVDSMMQNDSHSKHQEWLNTKEAAKALGISTRKLQDLRNSSALPFSQFG
ncbi:MAG: helix-turn-helix domain-containing protein, partial [Bacteroidales bacterium]|nr:helix-turn-helix domain-containing protein [Bacteroidales bacterium]